MRIRKLYAAETGADGSKTVHSFVDSNKRAAWIGQNPATRAEVPSASKTVLQANYHEAVIAHLE